MGTKPVLVDTFNALKAAAGELAGAERYFLDTEFERSRTTSKLCLLQVSRGATVYVVDTVRLRALEPLRDAIVRPGVEWVLHDPVQDLEWIREAFRLPELPPVFDTQTAWALQGPEFSVSLAYLMYRVLGVRSPKEHQAADWMGRPLSREQVEYAGGDVEPLPAIHERLSGRLAALGRLDLVREVSAESAVEGAPGPVSVDDFRNAWQLDAAGQAALRYLVEWYNGLEGEDRRYAPHPKVLLTIAVRLPESGRELAGMKGVHVGWARRNGDRLTSGLIRATKSVSEEGFTPLEPPPYNTFERILAEARLRMAAAEVCAEVEIAPELAFPSRILRRMVSAALERGTGAAADSLEGWRERVLKAPLVRKL